MKFLILVACLALAGLSLADDPLKLSDEQKKKVHAYVTECVEKEKVTPEAAQFLRKGDFTHGDEKVKCFANCFLEKAGFYADGVVKGDTIKAKLGPLVGDDKLKDIMAKCDDVKGSDKCDTAFKLCECYYKNHAGLV